MDKKELQKLLNQPYKQENWREIIQFVFPNVSILSTPKEFPINNDKIKKFRQIGSVKLNDGKSLALFELLLADTVNVQRNRVELNNEISKYIDQEQIHGVLSVFEQGTDDYRFTFSARSTEFDEEENDFVVKKTDTKRFTYVLGKNESCKTPAERFFNLSENKAEVDIKAIQHAFSVEQLSKEFFNNYKKQFEKFWTYIATNDQYKNIYYADDKEKKELKIRNFTKKLLGRIVFLHFLQKKGWMGCSIDVPGWENGDKHFMKNLFNGFVDKNNFHSKCLSVLFYKTLNRKREGQLFACTGLNNNLNMTKVPYLNGGLFDSDEVESLKIDFPENYFEELFEFFGQYNFTIDENDPNDHEVGIDPEMLGHIFENLLEDNKDKGAFYTPKIIVQYMCQESLIEYISTKLKAEGKDGINEAIKELIRNRLAEKSSDLDLVESIAQALFDVKVCDPAIGSGAFPMGILHVIFQTIQELYSFQPDTVARIWNINDKEWQPHLVKKNIIQHSIYGVDLESGAIDIARLRFWLALVVDEKEPLPLPNLDYKIMQGNSLLESFEGIDLSQISNSAAYESIYESDQIDIFSGVAKKKVSISLNFEDIKALMDEYFSTNDPYAKKDLHKRIDDQVLNHIHLTLSDHKKVLEKKAKKLDNKLKLDEAAARTWQQKEKIRTTSKDAKELFKLNKRLSECDEKEHKLAKLFKSNERPFFLWHLFFRKVFDNGGFDIVIGNPPYVSAVTMARSKEENKIFKTLYPLATGSYDLYLLFLLLAIKITNENGVYSWIIPNKFLIASYASNSLNFLKETAGLSLALNVSSFEVFKGVGVYPIILQGKKGVEQEYKELLLERYSDLIIRKFKKPVLLPNHKTIDNCSMLINSGATGFQAQQILPYVQSGSSTESIPFIVSGSVDRYIWDNSEVRYMKNKFIDAHISNNEFVADSKWLFWNSPKIVIAGMTKLIEAVYVESPLALGVGIYGIYDFGNYEPYALTAILNSKYLTYYFKIKFKDKHLAGGYLAINKGTILEFPIPEISNQTQLTLTQLSKKLHLLKLSDEEILDIENQIDLLIFKSFNIDYKKALEIINDTTWSLTEYQNCLE